MPLTYMPKKPKVQKTPANLRLPTWLKESSQARAASRGYELSDLVSRLLEQWLREEEANPGKNLPPPTKKS